MKPLKKLEELGISPAPWKVIPYTLCGDICFANEETMFLSDRGIEPPKIADARLIAAAPDMYDALWDLLFGKTGYCNVCRGHELGNCKECDYGKAMAALEKAGGV